MTEKMTLALIYGSARQGRFCDTVASWLIRELETSDVFSLTIIDPVRMKSARGDKSAGPAEWMERKVAEADAFIVITPEYNHGYPAALKEMIDAVYEPWHAKPVAFVSYGGASGGIRAVEQLRQVFGELHAVTLRDLLRQGLVEVRCGGKSLQTGRDASAAVPDDRPADLVGAHAEIRAQGDPL